MILIILLSMRGFDKLAVFFFSSYDRFIIATALQRLLKTVRISDAALAALNKTIVDEVEWLRAATTKVKTEKLNTEKVVVKFQEVGQEPPTDVASSRERVPVYDLGEDEFFRNVPANSSERR